MKYLKRAVVFILSFLAAGGAATYVVSLGLTLAGVPPMEASPVFGPVFLVFGIGTAIWATKKWA